MDRNRSLTSKVIDELPKTDYENTISAPFTDGLTGLFNHGFFQVCLERELKGSDRHGDPFTLALVDIDWFSGYNKRNGALNGDLMLKQVAALVGKSIRGVDLAARYAGDVFALMLIKATTDQAHKAAERIRSAVEKMSNGVLTVSIGLAPCTHAASRDSLIKKAQDALTQAKIRGKNRVHFFTAEPQVIDLDRPRVMVVDDEPCNLELLEALLTPLNYEVIKISNGEHALHLASKTEIDLILLDITMPGMDGYEVCRRLKTNENTRLIPVLLLTDLDGMDTRVSGIEAGADDFLSKPPNQTELLARTKSLVAVKSLNSSLTSIESLLFSLAATVEARDKYTDGHVQRVAHMAVALGKKLGLSGKEQKALQLGAILHDIGKITVPDQLLNKPGPLTKDEWQLVSAHADAGYKICLPLKKSLGDALDIIRYHHEKMDGSGYPDGLKGEEIPINARVMAVVDIYDALVTDRPYRKKIAKQDGLDIMWRMVAEGQLDEQIMQNFMEMLG